MSANYNSLGLDLGSSRTVVACAKKRGVDIVVNDASNRETVNIVAFTKQERLQGEQAQAQYKSNFQNTCQYFTRLLGHKTRNSDQSENIEIEKESKFITTKLGESKGTVGYDVTYQKEQRVFTAQQVTTCMLERLKQTINKNNLESKEAVISVPNYFSQQERLALLDACKVAEIKVQRLVNESQAISLQYGLYRRNEFDAKEGKNVIFIDLGHSKFSAFVCKFTNEKATVLASQDNRHLGCRNMDWITLEFYNKMFINNYDISFIKNKKARLRVLDFIEKQRRVLSGNKEAAVNVECLCEDEDLNHVMSREQYVELQTPFFNQIRDELNQLKKECESRNIKIDDVEIIGGGTRIPAVQDLICEVFQIANVSRTMSADECIARGCAILSAIMSPFFQIPDYQLESVNNYNISALWRYTQKNHLNEVAGNDSDEPDLQNNTDKQQGLLFKQGSVIPCVKSVNLTKPYNVEFIIFYKNPVDSFDSILGRYLIKVKDIKETEFSVKVKVKMDENGVVDIDCAQLIEEYMEEKKVPKKKEDKDKKMEVEDKKEEKMEVEEEFEVQQVKKQRITTLNQEGYLFNQMNKSQIQQCFEEEIKMANNDRQIQEILKKKNELESYVYDIRQKITSTYENYTDKKTADIILELCDQNECWLYGDGVSANKSAFQIKLDEMTKFGRPIEERFREFSDLPEHFQALQNAINEASALLNSTDEKYNHITAEERIGAVNFAKDTLQWMNENRDKVDKQTRQQLPVVSCKQVDERINQLVGQVKSTMSKPKPQPKKEEKKEEEKKEEEKKEEEKKEEEKKPDDMEVE